MVSFLDDDAIRDLFVQAGQESEPGTDAAHEEGGFVLRNADGSLSVERWPKGVQDKIFVPLHPGGKRGDLQIVATMQANGIDRIYTFNTGDFGVFPELAVVSP